MSVTAVGTLEPASHAARCSALGASSSPAMVEGISVEGISVEGISVEGISLIDLLLKQQQETAVEKYARLHDEDAPPLQARFYRDLIPLESPKKGQQYAFEVDLDSCTGCKACVTACHNLNGLEEDETWRKVGLLTGGSSRLPVLQHVTTACHHCVEPACMQGCPVQAYEKDPITGIVRHLDDQCIGCQYCILKCPYDVPRYSKSKGIVRKCDMCSNRLADGEAPACVQACPNSAIRITIVDRENVIAKSAANMFLPGAPEPGYTQPSTVYKSQRSLPANLLPADYWSVTPQHSHLPLVVMLVLTQMSVGTFVVEQILTSYFGWLPGSSMTRVHAAHAVAGLVVGILGMNASLLHLGRPLYAFRAMIGLRTSWLSREILAFSVFAGLASAYTGAACAFVLGIHLPRGVEVLLGGAAAISGLAGVACSMKIYADTRRPFWDSIVSGPKFYGTALVLGLPAALLICLGATLCSSDLTIAAVMAAYGKTLCRWLVCVAAGKMLFESLIFVSLRQRQPTPLRRTAQLMTGELGLVTMQRFFFGLIGGVLLPGLLLLENSLAPGGYSSIFVVCSVILIIAVLLLGELLERYLFFTAVVAPKMPGSPAS